MASRRPRAPSAYSSSKWRISTSGRRFCSEYFTVADGKSETRLKSSPVAVGTIAILVLFAYLRLSSNRCVAPVTLFDWILNVALGSTLAGIVNGTSLARGMLSLAIILLFQLLA